MLTQRINCIVQSDRRALDQIIPTVPFPVVGTWFGRLSLYSGRRHTPKQIVSPTQCGTRATLQNERETAGPL